MLVMPQIRGAARPVTGFLSKYVALFDIVLRAGDVLIVLAAAVLATQLRFGMWVEPQGYPVGMVRAALLTVIVFRAFNLYRSWRGAPVWAEALRLSLAWGTVAMGMLVINWALKASEHYSRLWMAYWWLLALVLFLGTRGAVRGLLALVRLRGLDLRKVVLVGATEAGQRLLHATRTHPWMGLSVTGYVATPYDQLAYDADLPCAGQLEDYLQTLAENPPDQLWIALPLSAEPDIKAVLEATADLPMQVRLAPDFFGYELINHHSGSVGGVPIITLRGNRVEGHARVVKAVVDRLFALVFLMITSPIFLVLAIGVKLSSPGPVFYRQRRMGLDGKEFDMLKFRSMPVDAEQGGVVWGNAKSKPMSRFGRFIRATSLDELPQFINVLKGELSIVGPRPERPMFVQQFKSEIPGYMHKHLVKGGITGWAQIHGLRGDTDLTKRIQYDLHYIKNWSIWLDLKIILRTPLVLLKGT